MNVLIVGARGAGKTTLIRRVLESLDCPVWGFETEKEGDQVHIYDAGAEHVPTEENLVGLCGETRGFPVKEGFDRYAPRILAPVKAGSVMIMDELGYLESSSELFCRGRPGRGKTLKICFYKAFFSPYLHMEDAWCFLSATDGQEERCMAGWL